MLAQKPNKDKKYRNLQMISLFNLTFVDNCILMKS